MMDDDDLPEDDDSASNQGSEVGYGKPPVATRFKPGQSGNPKGRRKGKVDRWAGLTRESFLQIFYEEAHRTVAVTEGGKHRKMTRVRALIRQLINLAPKDPRLMAQFVKYFMASEQAAPGSEDEVDLSQLSTAELITLRDLQLKAMKKKD